MIRRDENGKPDERYANMPDEAVPYRRFTKPYYDWFVQTIRLPTTAQRRSGPDGDPSKLSEIAIGFMAPHRKQSRIHFRPTHAARRATRH